MSICIIDYGNSNVNSIKSALDILEKKSIISQNKKDIELSFIKLILLPFLKSL